VRRLESWPKCAATVAKSVQGATVEALDGRLRAASLDDHRS